MHVTSLAKFLRRYKANKKTKIIVGTSLEVEIWPNATALGRRRTFLVAKSDLVGGDMKVATINTRSVNINTPEPLRPATDGDGGDRDAYANMTTTGDTTITDPVSVQVFEAPALDPLNDEAFRVVVTQPMTKTPGRPLSPLTEDGGSVVGGVLAQLMDLSTVEMPPPPSLPRFLLPHRFIPVPLPPTPLPPILAPNIPST